MFTGCPSALEITCISYRREFQKEDLTLLNPFLMRRVSTPMKVVLLTISRLLSSVDNYSIKILKASFPVLLIRIICMTCCFYSLWIGLLWPIVDNLNFLFNLELLICITTFKLGFFWGKPNPQPGVIKELASCKENNLIHAQWEARFVSQRENDLLLLRGIEFCLCILSWSRRVVYPRIFLNTIRKNIVHKKGRFHSMPERNRQNLSELTGQLAYWRPHE